MNREQYLLTKLAEECSEVAQMALKCQQFGLGEVKPGEAHSNRERLNEELNDLNGIVQMLNEETDLKYSPDAGAMMEKAKKVELYHGYSVGLGRAE